MPLTLSLTKGKALCVSQIIANFSAVGSLKFCFSPFKPRYNTILVKKKKEWKWYYFKIGLSVILIMWRVVVSFSKNWHLQSLTESLHRHVCHNFLNIGQNRTVIMLAEICTVRRPNLCVCKAAQRYSDKWLISVCRANFVIAKSDFSSHPLNQESFHRIHWEVIIKTRPTRNTCNDAACVAGRLFVCVVGCGWWAAFIPRGGHDVRWNGWSSHNKRLATWLIGMWVTVPGKRKPCWVSGIVLRSVGRSGAAGCKWGKKQTDWQKTYKKEHKQKLMKYIVSSEFLSMHPKMDTSGFVKKK